MADAKEELKDIQNEQDALDDLYDGLANGSTLDEIIAANPDIADLIEAYDLSDAVDKLAEAIENGASLSEALEENDDLAGLADDLVDAEKDARKEVKEAQ